MFSTILLTLAPGLPGLALAPSATTPSTLRQEGPNVEEQIAAAGTDVAKLEALAAAFMEAEEPGSARLVHVRIVQLDPGNEASHKALSHHFYDGQWFTTYSALSAYRRDEAKRMKEEFGLVRYEKEWVPEKDLPFIRMGWTKEGDEYLNPAVAQRRKEAAELTAKGFQQRPEDSLWIDPAEFEHWSGGLFKVGDDWVSEAEANSYHAQIGQWWKYRGEYFVAFTTCNREAAAWVAWWADKTHEDLVRLFGVEPQERPVFACLSSLAQYNAFAAGDGAQRPPTESGGFSSCHFAYIGDAWFDISNPQAPEYIGGGIGFYDVNDEALKPWGQFSVRHAAGLSYAESIDRAWDTISKAVANPGNAGIAADQIWREKRIPRWLVYGGASYVERYAANRDATEEQGGPWGVRTWAFEQVKNGGKLGPLEQVFAMNLDLNDIDGSRRRIHEGGVLTSFLLDGGCKPVTAAHAAFRQAMLDGADTDEANAALQQAILDNTDALVAFAGVEIATPGTKAGTAPAAEAAATDGAAGAGEGL